MAKEKKISVRFFLNTKLKSLEENGKLHYPIYVHINYDRNNTKFTFDWNTIGFTYFLQDINTDDFSEYGYVTNEMFRRINLKIESNIDAIPKEIDNGVEVFSHEEGLVKALANVQDRILEIITYERKKSNFSLRGFSKRFHYYESSPSYLYDKKLSLVIVDELEGSLDRFEKKKLSNYVFLFEKYYYLLNKNLINKLSTSTKNSIETYFCLALFEADNSNGYRVFDWLKNDRLGKGYNDFYDKDTISVSEDCYSSYVPFFESNDVDFHAHLLKIKKFIVSQQ